MDSVGLLLGDVGTGEQETVEVRGTKREDSSLQEVRRRFREG